MQNYICLNPSQYHVQLASYGIANRVGDRERRCERRLKVRANRAVHRTQVVSHVAVENLGRRALDQQRPTSYGRRALVTLPESGPALLRRDVVGDGSARKLTDGFVCNDVDRFDRIVRALRERDRDGVGSRPARLRSSLTIEGEREENVALCLLGVAEEALHARPVGALPKSVRQLEDVAALPLLLLPVGVIESVALVAQRLDEEPKPVAVRPGLEVSGEERNRVCLLL